jgi:aspartyl/asparaginyl beta-hydroxylase (cupin superfamily)
MPRQPNEPPVTLTGDIGALQTHYAAIREELMSVITQEKALFQPFDSAVYKHATTSQQQQQQNQQQQAEWSSIYLYRQGIKQVETCKTYFPITTNILQTMCPHHMGGKCGFGSIYLSKLKQNTKVVEHCGPTNVRLRCHLPLVVPKHTSGSYLKVGEHCVTWEEGIPILFDDSFVHSAVYVRTNDRSGSSSDIISGSSNEHYDGDRIVLIVDLWHPALSESDRTALGVLYPPGS